MKTMIIDNDATTIAHLEHTLESIGMTTIISKQTCALKAKEEIIKLRPDLIIMDSDIKEVDSLALAKEMEKKFNDIKMIFITSREKINIKAFELNQVDFILKPVEEKRIRQSLQKFSPDFFKLSNEVTQLISFFKYLKCIELYQNGRIKLIDLNWRTRYAKEIFAYLIAHQEVNVRKDVFIDMFWHEALLKDAYHNLYTHVYFIRKTLQEVNIPILINNHGDFYSLNMNGVKTDFEFLVDQINRYKYVNLIKLERAMDLYKGHFLEEENYFWAGYKTQKYRLIWLETMEYIIETYKKENNISRAIINALYVQNIEPYIEKPYYILMDLYSEIRDFNSVRNEYQKLEQMLHEEYNTKPENKLNHYLKI